MLDTDTWTSQVKDFQLVFLVFGIKDKEANKWHGATHLACLQICQLRKIGLDSIQMGTANGKRMEGDGFLLFYMEVLCGS